MGMAFSEPGTEGSKSGPRDPRSRSKYNICSRLLFCWLESLFCNGCCHGLEQDDLYVHPTEVDAKELLSKFNRYWQCEIEKKKCGGKARLWLAVVKCVWWRLVVQSFMAVMQVAALVSQSVVLGNFIDYFSISNPTSADTRNAYLYAIGLVLLGIVALTANNFTSFIGQKMGMLVRICTTGAIYQKILKLNQSAVSNVSTGYIVNLASNDVHRFDSAFYFAPFLLVGPLHLVVVTYLVYLETGWTSFLFAGFLAMLNPLQLLLAWLNARIRERASCMADKRVKVMNEVISGIRVIKMYTWEYAFKKMVSNLRRLESVLILKATLIRACNSAFFVISRPLGMFIIFIPYVLTDGELTPRAVFTTLSLLTWVIIVNVNICVVNILVISDGFVAASRIQKLLELEELTMAVGNGDLNHALVIHTLSSNNTPEKHNVSHVNLQDNEGLKVAVEELSASWGFMADKLALSSVNFELKDSSLLAIVGPVGAGKSTILQCLLKELKPLEGSIKVSGQLSYASQEPWVFSGSVKDNILFSQPYCKSRYDEVIDVCALKEDLSQLIHGDQTLVGERGVTLSGGQKARVSLARAVYSQADIYLLDDPLSAVDTAVGKHIFEKCIQGLLRNKAIILVTHQLQFAQQCDQILAINHGCVEAYGSYSELLSRGIDTVSLLGVENQSRDEFCYEHASEGVEDGYQHRKTSEEATHVLRCPPPEEKSHGSVSMSTYYHYFRAGGTHLMLLLVFIVFILGEGITVLSDWWISDWADCSVQNITNYSAATNISLRATCNTDTQLRTAVYAATIITAVLVNFIRSIALFSICVNASRVLHDRMFASVLRAPTLFFDTNPIGRVLNRFSKDIGFLDDQLPWQFMDCLFRVLQLLSVIVLTSVGNVYLLIAVFFVSISFLFMRWYYLKTAREVKRLEAISRSPFYSHISMTLQGLATIRSFKREETAMSLFYKFQNEHSQGWYLYLATVRWFAIRVDLLSIFLVAAIAFVAVPLASTLNATLVGLSISYSLYLVDQCQYCIRLSAEIENVMISAERVMSYSKLKSEAPFESSIHKRPALEWPKSGEIKMNNVSFKYSENLPLVLKSLSISIQSSEKVGVVGRTGAGKSSLIAVLFRMAEPSGVISIDGVNTAEIGLHDLRSKISIIPQDPVLFSGTMRYNLDPFDHYSDSDVWDALQQVQLKSVVHGMEGGLLGQVSEGGSNFSVGQRQLICLARALLRKNKILVLDEATANVDMRTDEVIQQTIREKFSESTVLTIAHRLNTVMDSDRILVLCAGMVMEFDSPHTLLQNSNSLFKKMVDQTGHSASRKLYQIAEEAYLKRRTKYLSGTSCIAGSHFGAHPVLLRKSRETTV